MLRRFHGDILKIMKMIEPLRPMELKDWALFYPFILANIELAYQALQRAINLEPRVIRPGLAPEKEDNKQH
jgi:hypothetical protein